MQVLIYVVSNADSKSGMLLPWSPGMECLTSWNNLCRHGCNCCSSDYDVTAVFAQ